jgi:hypothetical protein
MRFVTLVQQLANRMSYIFRKINACRLYLFHPYQFPGTRCPYRHVNQYPLNFKYFKIEGCIGKVKALSISLASAKLHEISCTSVQFFLTNLLFTANEFLEMDDKALELALLWVHAEGRGHRYEVLMAPLERYLEELRRKGVNRRVLVSVGRQPHPSDYSYAQFCNNSGPYADLKNISLLIELEEHHLIFQSLIFQSSQSSNLNHFFEYRLKTCLTPWCTPV